MKKFGENFEKKNVIQEIKHIGSEELKVIMEEYEKDPDNFYKLNKVDLWEGDKNPALIANVEMMAILIKEVWEEKKFDNADKVVKNSKNVAMLVMKYLGSDLDGFCKVDVKTAVETIQKMMSRENLKSNYELILNDIKKNDPKFSEFLAKVCVRDLETGEVRDEEEISAIVEMIGLVAMTMYEQMKKDAEIN